MTNPYAPPMAAVRDIADPYAGTVPADRGTRLGASILDSVIAGGMIYGPFMVAVLIGTASGGLSGGDEAAATATLAVGGFLAVVGLIVWAWLTIKYVKLNGQSIAKKICGIKVVRSNGEPISLGRIFWMRNVLNGVISIIPLYGLVDVLFIFSESRQCIHDKLADTIVVKA